MHSSFRICMFGQISKSRPPIIAILLPSVATRIMDSLGTCLDASGEDLVRALAVAMAVPLLRVHSRLFAVKMKSAVYFKRKTRTNTYRLCGVAQSRYSKGRALKGCVPDGTAR